MERLTPRGSDGKAYIKGIPELYGPASVLSLIQAVVDQNASYEDVGFEPVTLKEIFPTVTSVEEAMQNAKRTREQRDEWFTWKIAELDGRLTVFPCKVGDTLYKPNQKETVEIVGVDQHGIYVCTNVATYRENHFGKLIFFNKDEAIRAGERR